MKRARLTELLTARALAEGGSLVDALRVSRAARAAQAVGEVEAGRLGPGLRIAGLPKDQVALAEAWPTALPEFLRRLARLPGAFTALLPVWATLAYLLLVAQFQTLVALRIDQTVSPMLRRSAPESQMLDWVSASLDVLGPFTALLLLAALLLLVRPEWLPGWGTHRRAARAAAMRGALLATEAPPEVRVSLRADEGDVGPQVAFERALAAADVGERRWHVALRVLGIGLLTATAAMITLPVYYAVASVGVAWSG